MENVSLVKTSAFTALPCPNSRYQFSDKLGQGSYGDIYSAIDSETKTTVAVKCIRDVFNSVSSAKRAYRELKILKFLAHAKHENVVAFRDVVRPPHQEANAYKMKDVMLVLEKMDTDLYSFYRQYPEQINRQSIVYLMYQVLRGLKYIHSANIIHRDLKPTNLLLSADWDIKICDFGLATLEMADMSEYVQTRLYRAPEILLAADSYDKGVDMWSVGCILVELFLQRPLFRGTRTAHELITAVFDVVGLPDDEDLHFANPAAAECAKKVRDNLVKNGWDHPSLKDLLAEHAKENPDLVDLATKLLCINPDKRLTVEQALEHECFAQFTHSDIDEPCSKYEFETDEQVEGTNDLEFLRDKLFSAVMGWDQDDEWDKDDDDDEEEDEDEDDYDDYDDYQL
eukprot:TRINITY_DN66917_c7_g1_i1.p1 TRINITY_DN66917_c7_g1~~TRINITY_DN66917_c7_g1_i1.p1  ORF type:complete len:398 (+),score=57.48 TRINITY_DN66917_c7_g1_i1:85-1278(+)